VTLHRFCVRECHPGALLPLPPDVAHHARHVLRLQSGASVRVFDGQGSEYDATIEATRPKELSVRVGGSVPAAPESALHSILAFAPLSADLTSLVIQKAVELGVSELRPLWTARTEPPGRALLAANRIERLERVALAATAQSGRARVPEVRPITFDELVSLPVAGPRLLCCERPVAEPFPAPSERPRQVLIAVGPAGGWEDVEVERATAAGFVLLALGPRILRAETASVAAVAAAQLLWGDLSRSPWTDGGASYGRASTEKHGGR
jgi:16S rRNA (uracil1498-N3)-methyltransferase